YRMLADLGYVVGPITLGVVADLASPTAALWLTALLLTASGISFARFAPETHQRHKSAASDEAPIAL
nr:MFS transporter [Chloroflexota bacterium]